MIASTPTNIVLGLIAGMTIFLGLPIARLKSASASLRGSLVLASAGVLLFLIIEVGYQAIEILEMTAKSGELDLALIQGLIMVAGLSAGLIGLAAFEERRHHAKSGGSSPIEIATMIAIGIGLHNFAEGLAIGQSYSSGNVSLGLVLVIGFALHNATEGFGIAGPLAGSNVSWAQLIGLGLIGGGPTAVGAALGGAFVNTNLQLFILCLAVGSLIYVTRELLRLPFTTLSTSKAMMALTAGLIVGIATEIFIEAAPVYRGEKPNSIDSIGKETDKSSGKENIAKQISFEEKEAEPGQLTVEAGEDLLVINKTDQPLEFESNGLFSKELFIPKRAKRSATIVGGPGQYSLSPEGSQTIAHITVKSEKTQDPVVLKEVKWASAMFPGRDPKQVVDAETIVAALMTIEGHAQAAYDLHMHAQMSKGVTARVDLMRAGKHAHHPMHELLEDKTGKALMVQSALKKVGLLEDIKDNLNNYGQLASSKDIDNQTFIKAYVNLNTLVEKAGRLIAGDLYDEPAFRAAAAHIILEQAEDEYSEAVESGKIRVLAVAEPGKDGYLEYQDARGFLKIAERFLTYPEGRNSFGAARLQILALLGGEFRASDPKDPNHPTTGKEIGKNLAAIEKILQSIKPEESN